MHRLSFERKSYGALNHRCGENIPWDFGAAAVVRFTDMPLRGKRCGAVMVQFKLA
jgi:hypothetical protein